MVSFSCYHSQIPKWKEGKSVQYLSCSFAGITVFAENPTFLCHSVHCIVLSVPKIVISKSQFVEKKKAMDLKYIHLSRHSIIIIHIYNCTYIRTWQLILTTQMEDSLLCICRKIQHVQSVMFSPERPDTYVENNIKLIVISFTNWLQNIYF